LAQRFAVDECLTNQQINSVIANDETDSTFLYYLLCHSVDIVKALGGGAATPIVSKSKFEEVQLLVPPLREQKAIASFLAAYDDLIENNHRRIALLEDAAKHLYREWFVYLLFPGYEHTATTNGVPDGWRQTQLGQMLTLKRGHDLPSAERVDGEIPIVSSSGITGFHNEKKATAPGVVTGRYGTIGEVYYVQQDYWPLNTALYVCDFKGNPPAYVAHLLKHVLAGTQSDKAAVPGVNRNVLHRIPILAPTKRLIDQFAEFAQSTYQQIYVLDTMNQKLSSARDLLLPRLMSGEIAV
jgi:type I restriction enzyme S subunit